jgi:hypothetical protein
VHEELFFLHEISIAFPGLQDLVVEWRDMCIAGPRRKPVPALNLSYNRSVAHVYCNDANVD